VFLPWLAIEAGCTGALGWLALMNLPEAARRAIGRDLFWPMAFAVGIATITAIQLATFLAGAPTAFADAACLAIAAGALALRLRLRGWPRRAARDPGLVPFALWLVWLLLVLSFTPGHGTGYSSDWAYYWPNVRAYLGEADVETLRASPFLLEYLTKRTPLLSLFGSFWVQLAGRDFASFEVACLVPSSLVFWAVWLWAGRHGRPGARAIAAVLLVLAPAIARGASSPEPKAAAGALGVLALLEHVRARGPEESPAWRGAVVGFLAALAVATHPAVAFFVVWPFAVSLRSRDRWALGLWLGAGAVMLAIIAPWAIHDALAFGARDVLVPASAIAGEGRLTLGTYAWTKLTMTASTLFVPAPLLDAARGRTHWVQAVLRAYQDTYLFGATLAVALAAWPRVLLGRVTPAPTAAPRAVWVALAAGLLLSIAVCLKTDDPKGHAANLGMPLLLALLALAADALAALPRRALVAVLAAAAVELVAVRVLVVLSMEGPPESGWMHVYHMSTRGLLQLGPIARLVEPVAWAGLYAWALGRARDEVAVPGV
jgi:hypothetical protein